MILEYFLFLTELVGTIAFSVSGVLTAKRQKLDLFGALVLGMVTATGGGVLRDILMGHTPPVMFQRPVYAALALVTALAAFHIEKKSQLLEDSRKAVYLLNAADTIGLAVFAVSGTETVIASARDDNMFLAVFVGVITAVGGGILRDILAGRIPVVMRRRVYAVAALIGAVLYYLLRQTFGIQLFIAEVISIAVIGLIRFLAIHYLWNLPGFEENSHDKQTAGNQ